MRFILIAILCLGAIPFSYVRGAEINAGFVQGIWFGNETVFAGSPVRIYVALRNNDDHDLTGTVRFTDNEKRIGTSYVSALPGRLIEAWVDWTPTYGEHIVVATLSNTQIHPVGEDPEIIEVVSVKSEQTLFVDYDTDKDGVGDTDDTDDDNDKVSDTDEVTAGTDPRVYNAPKETAESEEAKKETENKENPNTEESTPNQEQAEVTQTPSSGGLEKYIQNETVHSILSTVTDTVTGTKEALDAYRETREDAMDKYLNEGAQSTITNPSDETASSSGIATITRSRIENTNKSFFEKILASGTALVSWLYSFILFLISSILAHPALVQLAILFGILMGVYTLARKIGRRPNTTK